MLLQPVFAVMASAAILTFLIQRKHFLMTLLSLEAITLISVGLIAASIGNTSELDITLFIIVSHLLPSKQGLGSLYSCKHLPEGRLQELIDKSLTSRKMVNFLGLPLLVFITPFICLFPSRAQQPRLGLLASQGLVPIRCVLVGLSLIL